MRPMQEVVKASTAQSGRSGRKRNRKYGPEVEHRIFLGGLCPLTSEKTLRTYLEKFGQIDYLHLPTKDGVGRGFAFVVFRDPSVAQEVLKTSHSIDGRGFTCSFTVKDSLTSDKILEETQRKIYVSGLPPHIDEDQLKTYFAKFGTVERATLNREPNGRLKGSGFILFECSKKAREAITHKRGVHRIAKNCQVRVFECLTKNQIQKHREQQLADNGKQAKEPEATRSLDSKSKQSKKGTQVPSDLSDTEKSPRDGSDKSSNETGGTEFINLPAVLSRDPQDSPVVVCKQGSICCSVPPHKKLRAGLQALTTQCRECTLNLERYEEASLHSLSNLRFNQGTILGRHIKYRPSAPTY